MSINQPSAPVFPAHGSVESVPVGLDLANAIRLVESALAGTGIAASERARLACAKTLVRLAPGTAGDPDVEDFAAVLREIGRG